MRQPPKKALLHIRQHLENALRMLQGRGGAGMCCSRSLLEKASGSVVDCSPFSSAGLAREKSERHQLMLLWLALASAPAPVLLQ